MPSAPTSRQPWRARLPRETRRSARRRASSSSKSHALQEVRFVACDRVDAHRREPPHRPPVVRHPRFALESPPGGGGDEGAAQRADVTEQPPGPAGFGEPEKSGAFSDGIRENQAGRKFRIEMRDLLENLRIK